MTVYRYTRLACQQRCNTCAAMHDTIIVDDAEDAVQDPIIEDDMDEQQDATSEDYSPLVYALVMYEEYLEEGEHAEVEEPEL